MFCHQEDAVHHQHGQGQPQLQCCMHSLWNIVESTHVSSLTAHQKANPNKTNISFPPKPMVMPYHFHLYLLHFFAGCIFPLCGEHIYLCLQQAHPFLQQGFVLIVCALWKSC